ncbi:hypothetical protein O181_005272 [Austropuccinia psidii MF-1]|uniref:Uncharacterized protein n=1 Tax=Austropuccinia psidii MF-1 TaxID=1389203 RepID=A0A9Q3BIF8_9BASI|nr:hypothetical protein [Austropuccinia psidii MF-1]
MCKQHFRKSQLTISPVFLFNSVEENYIPFETKSQANTPVTPSEPEGSKGKGKRHSEGLMTEKKWTPISTQRNRKPRNPPSIQGKPTLTTCIGNITIINPVVTSKGKFPKSADKKFVQGTVKETLASKGTNQRAEKACPEPDDLEEDTLDTEPQTRGLERHGSSCSAPQTCGWQDTHRNNTHYAIHFPIQQEPQTRGLERHGSSSSAPQTPQRFISMEQGQQEVQPGIPLGRTSRKFPEDLSQRGRFQRPYGNYERLESHQYSSYRRTPDPDRPYSDSFRLHNARKFPGEDKDTREKIRPPSARGRESQNQ